MRDPRPSGTDWFLGDAEEQHAANPRSFFIPGRRERESLQTGDDARLLFFLADPDPKQPRAERMWVEVTDVAGRQYIGRLNNQPLEIRDLAAGELVRFGPEHVIAVNDPRWAPYEGKRIFVSRRLLEDDRLEPGFAFHDPSDEHAPPMADGTQVSGWQLVVGDETEAELNDASNLRTPNLAWVMERYPAFGELVFSGAGAGEWQLDRASGRYVPTSG